MKSWQLVRHFLFFQIKVMKMDGTRLLELSTRQTGQQPAPAGRMQNIVIQNSRQAFEAKFHSAQRRIMCCFARKMKMEVTKISVLWTTQARPGQQRCDPNLYLPWRRLLGCRDNNLRVIATSFGNLSTSRSRSSNSRVGSQDRSHLP